MHPNLQRQLVEHRQSELRRAGSSRRAIQPRRRASARPVHAALRGLGLVLVRLGERLVGPEESGRRATIS